MMKRVRLVTGVGLAFAAALAAAPSAFALQQVPRVAIPEDARTAPLDEVIPPSPDVIVGELANGLRYYIRENDEPENRAQLRLVVRVGSVVEDDDQRGLAHVLEHMAFNGTEHFQKQELLDFMESIGMRLGAEVNAQTGFDDTEYRLEVPTDDPQYLETAFQILEDWGHGLTLDSDEIDQERGVVMEEWRMRRGASSRLTDEQFPVIFQGSRYADRLPIGTVESIENFPYDALRRFYRTWYRPNLIGVVAVGDFDKSSVEALLRQHFEGIQNPPDAPPRVEYPVPDHEGTLYSIVADPELSSTSVTVYFEMPPERDWTVGGYRQSLVEGMYNSMLNERFNEIALKPDAPFLSASSSHGQLVPTRDVYLLRATVQEDRVEDGLRAILTEAERVAQFGFTESELEREKTDQLRGIEQAYRGREDRSSSSYASEYIRAFLDGEAIPGIEYEYELYQRFIPEITLEEVNRVGDDWVTDESRVVLVSGPESEDVTLPDQDALAAVIASVGQQNLTAYVDESANAVLLAALPEGTPVVESRSRERDITEWVLGNGVHVVLKPTDFDQDQVVFRAFSPGGTSLASDDDFIPATTAADLIAGGGVGEFNTINLRRVLTGKVASVSPFISELEEGLSGSASAEDLETLFQLIYMRFTEPRADQDFFGAWMTQARQALENRDADPATAWSDTYRRLMTQDNPRARPMTLASLDDVDLQASLDFYRNRFADASDFTFVFVGAFDPDDVRPLVERYIGGLPSTGRQENWRDLGIRAPTGVHEEDVHKGIEPQSQTVITFNGPFDYEDQSQRSVIRALALALESELMDTVREQLGGSYSISVGPSLSWRPEQTYQMTIVFGSDPARVDEIVQMIFDEIESFKEDGPTEAQAASARQTLLRQFETDFQENRTWLSQLVSDYEREVDDPGGAVDTFESSVEALDVDAVRDAARQYLDTDNFVRVTLLPE